MLLYPYQQNLLDMLERDTRRVVIMWPRRVGGKTVERMFVGCDRTAGMDRTVVCNVDETKEENER